MLLERCETLTQEEYAELTLLAEMNDEAALFGLLQIEDGDAATLLELVIHCVVSEIEHRRRRHTVIAEVVKNVRRILQESDRRNGRPRRGDRALPVDFEGNGPGGRCSELCSSHRRLPQIAEHLGFDLTLSGIRAVTRYRQT